MNAACGGSHWTSYNALTAEINLHVASKRGMSPFVRKLLASYILHVPTGKSCTLHKVSVSSSPNYKISTISENDVDLWSSWIVYWGYRTHFNLWNVLIIWTPDFNYLIHFKSWDEWIFELTSILVPSYELRVMVLLSSGWRATVESLSSVHGSLQYQSYLAGCQFARAMHVGKVQHIFIFLIPLFRYSVLPLFHGYQWFWVVLNGY